MSGKPQKITDRDNPAFHTPDMDIEGDSLGEVIKAMFDAGQNECLLRAEVQGKRSDGEWRPVAIVCRLSVEDIIDLRDGGTVN